MGQQVLLATWHEDQYPGLMAAVLLGLHSFPIAVELLYLILSAGLSNLRYNTDETLNEAAYQLEQRANKLISELNSFDKTLASR